MNVRIDKQVKEILPNLQLGIIEANVVVSPSDDELWGMIDSVYKHLQETLTLEDVLKIESIQAARRSYKKLGKDPSRYRVSSDSLIRRIPKGMDLYKVNNIVDINNLISLETGHSLGCVDLAKVKGDVVFTKGNAGDYYEGIGRGQINLENMPVFKDDEGYFASTTSDSVRTQVTEESKHIMMMVICFEGDSKLNEYIEKINSLMTKYAQASILESKIIE
ncbi:MAG: hypothetical protein PWR23_1304 [Peptostreptococcaceae bacterium]|jgi:DNA/RNA-binding domain of Phe-tRNA-synthetase-like protein|nr:hypothetical protein [Peptostreptococcaceae bacterium]